MTNNEYEAHKVLVNSLEEQRIIIRKLTTELIEVKEEKAHNEQLLDAFQNTLAEFGYKLVDIKDG